MKPTPPLVSVCAWCQRERNERPQPGQTHGICRRHSDAALAEVILFSRGVGQSPGSMIDEPAAGATPAPATNL